MPIHSTIHNIVHHEIRDEHVIDSVLLIRDLTFCLWSGQVVLSVGTQVSQLAFLLVYLVNSKLTQ